MTAQTTQSSFLLCSTCACGVSNDDWSALDYHHDPEDADRILASITATMELIGWLSHVGQQDPGYYDCALCGDTHCGTAEEYTTDPTVNNPGIVLMSDNKTVRSYTNVGCYPLVYLDDQDNVVCPSCVQTDYVDNLNELDRPIASAHINYGDTYCDQCSQPIESA